VHRDIKPGNLLLTKDGTVKILDMGLARLKENELGDATPAEQHQLTQSGQIMGTVDYMAPEQAEDTRTADHRADVYSLGCTFYRLLTGESLYAGDTVLKKLLAHRGGEIPSLRAKRADVPAAVEAVFAKMVAKHPVDRQQSMLEVIDELQAAMSPSAPPQRRVRDESSSDHALTNFFAEIGGSKPAAAPVSVAAIARGEETLQRASGREDTGADKQPPKTAQTASAASRRRQGLPVVPLVVAGAALSLLLLFGAGGLLLWLTSERETPVAAAGDPPPDDPPQDRVQVSPAAPLPALRMPGVAPPAEPPPVLLPNGWAIGPPVNLGSVVNSNQSEGGCSISPDGLTLVFHSGRLGGKGAADIWLCTRPSTFDDFGEPLPLESVNSDQGDFEPSLSADGLNLAFATNRAIPRDQQSNGATELWIATRARVGDAFDAPRPIAAVNQIIVANGRTNAHRPHLSPDGLSLVFTIHNRGFYICRRNSVDEPFGEAQHLAFSSTEREAWLSPDGKLLISSSYGRSGGRGQMDLWMWLRDGEGSQFGPPAHLGLTVNTLVHDGSPSVSLAAQTLVFTSNRDGGHGTHDIYAAPIIFAQQEREIAQWWLDRGCSIAYREYHSGHKQITVPPGQPLPDFPFQINRINIDSKLRFNRSQVEQLKVCRNFQQIYARDINRNGVDWAGLAELQSLTTLE
jgi:Tol biopolymer transport system component